MLKTRNGAKLALRKDTLRTLGGRKLRLVRGGLDCFGTVTCQPPPPDDDDILAPTQG